LPIPSRITSKRSSSLTHPDVEPDPLPAPPPETGLDYLALLRAERQRLLQQQLEGIHFSQLTSPAQQTDEEQNDDQPE